MSTPPPPSGGASKTTYPTPSTSARPHRWNGPSRTTPRSTIATGAWTYTARPTAPTTNVAPPRSNPSNPADPGYRDDHNTHGPLPGDSRPCRAVPATSDPEAYQPDSGNQEEVMTTKVRREFETLASAAQRTGLSIRTLRRMIATGHLAAYRSGARVIRVNPEDVDRMMVRMPTASN